MARSKEQETKEKLKKLNIVMGIKNKPKKQPKPTFTTKEVAILLLITTIVSLILGSAVMYKISDIKGEKVDKELQDFITTYKNITENYNGTKDKEKLIDAAIDGMLDQLDENSTYLDSTTSNNLNINLEGSYQGLGIQIYNNEEGNIVIYSTIKNSPAAKAGLQQGDIIIKCNNIKATGMTVNEFTKKVKKQSGKTLKITYKRDGKEKKVKINMKKINLKSVTSKIITKDNKKIGYIYTSIFASNTYTQFKKQLEKLETKKIDSLIIDLRSNTGGYLSTAEDMISLFLDSNHVIYQIQKNKKTTKYYSKGKETKKYKIVVLVNSSSASAAEVMTSALKEQYGATIVGKTTYGKGTVQEMQSLSDGSQYKLTTKNWLTSKGKWVNKKGITPDVEVELEEKYKDDPSEDNDNQLQKAIEEAIK